MNTLSQLSYLSVRKSFVRFVAALLLSTLIVVGVVGPHSAYACTNVDVTVHSDDATTQTNYVLLRYQGIDGTTKFSACQSLSARSWQDLSVQAALGQSMNLNYYFDSSCNSGEFLAVTLPVPSQTDVAGCWFNPDNTNSANWSGCVNPSQTLTLAPISSITTNTVSSPSNSVGLTIHNDTSGQMKWATLTYKGIDGKSRDHVICQQVPPLSWVDMATASDPALPGQTMWLRYFHTARCNPSDRFLSVGLPIPANPVYNHCWFNPDNTNSPNWSGCVNPSQTLSIGS